MVEKMNLSDIVASEIKSRILNNVWEVGNKIPSESELSKEFNVNRLTVRLAINKLNTLGILETKTGEGTFVKRLNIYNYINQIIPFVVSSNEINHIIDFEKTILEFNQENKLNKDELKEVEVIFEKSKGNIEKLKSIYKILKQYDKNIVEEIANDYSRFKKMIFIKSENSIIKSLITSLEKMLIENDIDEINKANPNELDFILDRIIELKNKYQ